MTFDTKYYTDKKQKLVQKAQQLQNEYLQGAFKFTTELTDIQLELNKIIEWEKENPVNDKEVTEPAKSE